MVRGQRLHGAEEGGEAGAWGNQADGEAGARETNMGGRGGEDRDGDGDGRRSRHQGAQVAGEASGAKCVGWKGHSTSPLPAPECFPCHLPPYCLPPCNCLLLCSVGRDEFKTTL